MKKYYAYLTPKGGKQGITDSWAECERMVSGKQGARFMSFDTREAAEVWLRGGAVYVRKDAPAQIRRSRSSLEAGIYFDAGTGRGLGRVEVNVTDKYGASLLAKISPPIRITKFGTYMISRESATNNYGELLGLHFALEVAKKEGVKKIFGDSKLVIDYWSVGHIKRGPYHKSTYALVKKVTELREQFEERGGELKYISGDINPADLGFHR